MSDPTDPNLPDVESPPADDVLEQAPSKEEVIEQAPSADEVIAGQPSVDEILGDEFPRRPRS
jgi:hypothetical protein